MSLETQPESEPETKCRTGSKGWPLWERGVARGEIGGGTRHVRKRDIGTRRGTSDMGNHHINIATNRRALGHAQAGGRRRGHETTRHTTLGSVSRIAGRTDTHLSGRAGRERR